MELEDCCLASQEIREMVKSGIIYDPSFDESRIQPSSFEPTIGNEIFVLDTDKGLFRPSAGETIYRTLLKLPSGRRKRCDISNGFEVKSGFSYLLPLEQRIRGGDSFRFMKSSPKSSVGRVFPNTRLLTDHSPSFDESFSLDEGKEAMMWLLLQPTAFNLILSPGLTLTQNRFFRGFNAQLTPGEIAELWKTGPLLYTLNGNDKRVPAKLDLAEALQVHADLQGRGTEGIVALRARKNPEPIDLRKKGVYGAEDYFEPLKAKNGVLVVRPREHYLMASEQILNIPSNLNTELRAHSHQGINGSLHQYLRMSVNTIKLIHKA